MGITAAKPSDPDLENTPEKSVKAEHISQVDSAQVEQSSSAKSISASIIEKQKITNNLVHEKSGACRLDSELYHKDDVRNRALDIIGSALCSSKLHMLIVGFISVVMGIILWHYLTKYNFNFFINFENVPAPQKVGAAFLSHIVDSEFHTHILVSLRRIAIAYSFAVVLGIAIGLLVGRSKLARAAVLPYIEIVRPIPAVAWIPLAILMWPTEESSIVYITFLGALFPIILNTVHGVEQTPEVLIRAALSLGAKRLQVFWHVVLPAALPSIGAGLAIGMGVSWFSLLAGEIISGQYGIGYFTWNAYSLINYPDIIVGMLIIGGLGSLSTYLVRLIMSPALRWKNVAR